MRHPVTGKTGAGNLSADLRAALIAEIQAARHQLMTHTVPTDAAIHGARQCVKRARATLRLLRVSVGDRAYRRANNALRDAASPLRGVRDAKVSLDTLDDLRKRSRLRTSATPLRHSYERQRIAARYMLLHSAPEVRATISNLAAMVHYVRLLSVKGDGLNDVLIGARRTYAKGRTAFATAQRTPSDHHFHAWRKQTKYLLYQLRILQRLKRNYIGTLIPQARHLCDLLGDDHDLAVLRQRTREKRDDLLAKSASAALAACIDRRRATLQRKSITLGARLYRRASKHFMRQLSHVHKG
jgi:CHAD domain-containing protein